MIEHCFRIVVVDDHPLLGAGLASVLIREGMSAEVADRLPAGELIEWIGRVSPACVVLDLGLPVEGGGLALIEPLVLQGSPVAVLTGETEASLWAACLDAGADVVLAKSEPMADIVDAVRSVGAGVPVRPQQRVTLAAESRRLARERGQRLAPFETLSPREQEVLAGLMDGHSPAELAERDFVSVQTVRTQIKSVLRKLGVRSQLGAVARANASGWDRCRSARGGVHLA